MLQKGDAAIAREETELPDGWEWQHDWDVDLNRAVDEEGWEYTVEATLGGYGPVEKTYHMCRRRRWLRLRKLVKTSEMKEEDVSILWRCGLFEVAEILNELLCLREEKGN